jgi:hypothetical protein
VGRGSARLFSPLLQPQTIAGRHYVAVDMGANPRMFLQSRRGLMRWFGTSVPLDSRRINGFLRDVSAVGGEQYDNLQAPTAISRFPADLASRDLEYSGIYEDGWVAEDSFLRLRQPVGRSQLVVRAMVPGLLRGATAIRVFADGNPVAQSVLRPGDNEVRAILEDSAEGPAARRRIDLKFDRGTGLPAPDGRIVSAQLKFVGFSGGPGSPEEIAAPPIRIRDHWYPFEKFGGKTFRWVENDAQFSITAHLPAGSSRQSGELAIDLEPGPGMGGKPLAVDLVLPNGGKRTLAAVTGRQTIRTALVLGSGITNFALRCKGGGRAIPSDPRKLNFRVFALSWTPR